MHGPVEKDVKPIQNFFITCTEEAKEQARRLKKQSEEIKEAEDAHLPPLPPLYPGPPYRHWPGDPNLSGLQVSDSEYRPSDQHTVSSMPPDVTLTTQHVQGM